MRLTLAGDVCKRRYVKSALIWPSLLNYVHQVWLDWVRNGESHNKANWWECHLSVSNRFDVLPAQILNFFIPGTTNTWHKKVLQVIYEIKISCSRPCVWLANKVIISSLDVFVFRAQLSLLWARFPLRHSELQVGSCSSCGWGGRPFKKNNKKKKNVRNFWWIPRFRVRSCLPRFFFPFCHWGKMEIKIHYWEYSFFFPPRCRWGQRVSVVFLSRKNWSRQLSDPLSSTPFLSSPHSGYRCTCTVWSEWKVPLDSKEEYEERVLQSTWFSKCANFVFHANFFPSVKRKDVPSIEHG